MKSHKLGRFRGPRTEGSAGGVCEGKAEEAQRASEHAVFGDRPKTCTVSQAEVHTCHVST